MNDIWFFLSFVAVAVLFGVWYLQYVNGGKVLQELKHVTVEHVRLNSWQNKYELILRKDNHNHKFYISRQHFLLLEVGYVVSVKYDDNFYIQEVRYATV